GAQCGEPVGRVQPPHPRRARRGGRAARLAGTALRYRDADRRRLCALGRDRGTAAHVARRCRRGGRPDLGHLCQDGVHLVPGPAGLSTAHSARNLRVDRRVALAALHCAGGAGAAEHRDRVGAAMKEGGDALAALAGYFALMSLFAIGGANSAVPEMQRIAVEVEGWMTARQFTDIFAIAQVTPGPNVIIVALIGYH